MTSWKYSGGPLSPRGDLRWGMWLPILAFRSSQRLFAYVRVSMNAMQKRCYLIARAEKKFWEGPTLDAEGVCGS